MAISFKDKMDDLFEAFSFGSPIPQKKEENPKISPSDRATAKIKNIDVQPVPSDAPAWANLSKWEYERHGKKMTYYVTKEVDGIMYVYADAGKKDIKYPVYAGVRINKSDSDSITPGSIHNAYSEVASLLYTPEEIKLKKNTANHYIKDIVSGDDENQMKVSRNELIKMPPFVYNNIIDGMLKLRKQLKNAELQELQSIPANVQSSMNIFDINGTSGNIYARYMINIGRLTIGIFNPSGTPLKLEDEKELDVTLNVETVIEVNGDKKVEYAPYELKLYPIGPYIHESVLKEEDAEPGEMSANVDDKRVSAERSQEAKTYFGGSDELINRKSIGGVVNILGKDVKFHIQNTPMSDEVRNVTLKIKKLHEIIKTFNGFEGVIRALKPMLAITSEHLVSKLDRLMDEYSKKLIEINSKLDHELSGEQFIIAKDNNDQLVDNLKEEYFGKLAELISNDNKVIDPKNKKKKSVSQKFSDFSLDILKYLVKAKGVKKTKKNAQKVSKEKPVEAVKDIDSAHASYKEEVKGTIKNFFNSYELYKKYETERDALEGQLKTLRTNQSDPDSAKHLDPKEYEHVLHGVNAKLDELNDEYSNKIPTVSYKIPSKEEFSRATIAYLDSVKKFVENFKKWKETGGVKPSIPRPYWTSDTHEFRPDASGGEVDDIPMLQPFYFSETGRVGKSDDNYIDIINIDSMPAKKDPIEQVPDPTKPEKSEEEKQFSEEIISQYKHDLMSYGFTDHVILMTDDGAFERATRLSDAGFTVTPDPKLQSTRDGVLSNEIKKFIWKRPSLFELLDEIKVCIPETKAKGLDSNSENKHKFKYLYIYSEFHSSKGVGATVKLKTGAFGREQGNPEVSSIGPTGSTNVPEAKHIIVPFEDKTPNSWEYSFGIALQEKNAKENSGKYDVGPLRTIKSIKQENQPFNAPSKPLKTPKEKKEKEKAERLPIGKQFGAFGSFIKSIKKSREEMETLGDLPEEPETKFTSLKQSPQSPDKDLPQESDEEVTEDVLKFEFNMEE